MSGKIIEEKITISDSLIQKFGDFSGDYNPVHFNDNAAIAQGFKGRIAHGMLTSSLFSGILANVYPGPGTIYLSQTFKFHAPIYLNEEITLRLELIQVREGKPIGTFKTEAFGPDGTIRISGEAVVRSPQPLPPV